MENFKIKSSQRQALLLATLGFFAGFAGVSAYGPIVPILKKAMGLSPIMAGLLAAIPALTGSLLRIPFGAMVDRSGGKRPILILLTLSMTGIALIAILFSFNPNPSQAEYWAFALLGMLAGCGIATFSVGVATVSYWFPQRAQGRALAVYGGLGNTAPGIFALILPLIVSSLGLTLSYVIWFVGLFIFITAFLIFMHDAPSFQLKAQGFEIRHEDPSHRERLHKLFGQELIPTGRAKESLVRASRDIRTWLLTGIYFTTFGGFIALTAWFPTYWTQVFGWGIVLAGIMTALYSISASLFRVAGGFFSDRFGGERILSISIAMIVVGSVTMAFVDTSKLYLAIVGLAFIAVGMGFGNASVFKLVPKFAPKTVGGSAGLVGGLGAFGGFVIPLLLGGIVNAAGSASGYAYAFLIFTGLGLVSFVLLGFLRGQACNVAIRS